jgi:thioredoxin reductase (NADPH)
VNHVDALIVGGGPAGCSCAIWLRQLGFGVAMVERRAQLGGLQADSPYPNRWIAGVMDKTGIEFARDLDAHVRSLEIPVRRGSPARVERLDKGFSVEVASDAGTEALACEHLVIATGVEPRTGDLAPGPGVVVGPGLPVERTEFTGKRVAILGGGDNAAENYAIISAKAPARLLMFARTVRARPSLLARVPQDARRVGEYRADAARRTVVFDGREESFDVLVVLYGWHACVPPAVLTLDPGILDGRGSIATDSHRETRVPGLWAIGEVTQAAHPCCVTAMSDGVVCAKAIESRRHRLEDRSELERDRMKTR